MPTLAAPRAGEAPNQHGHWEMEELRSHTWMNTILSLIAQALKQLWGVTSPLHKPSHRSGTMLSNVKYVKAPKQLSKAALLKSWSQASLQTCTFCVFQMVEKSRGLTPDLKHHLCISYTMRCSSRRTSLFWQTLRPSLPIFKGLGLLMCKAFAFEWSLEEGWCNLWMEEMSE